MENFGHKVLMLKNEINNQKKYISIYSECYNCSGVHDNRYLNFGGIPLILRNPKVLY